MPIHHMSRVFTDVRLKPILELRSADSLPVPFVNALTALSYVLFYDDEKVHLYCLNQSSVNEHIDVIINNNSYLEIPVMEPNVYHFLTIGEIKDVKKIKLLS